jgi:two-component system NtrC family sensor kinase
VLVVDDHPGLRNAICAFLRRRGCVVETAADGREALERLDHARFDAVVSDLEMPVMGGETFWRSAVKLRPELRRRFVFCSGSPLPPELAAEPEIRFIRKPFDPLALWAALAELLD